MVEEETLCCLESKLVREESLSIPKPVFVKEENVHSIVTVESEEAKVFFIGVKKIQMIGKNMNRMCFSRSMSSNVGSKVIKQLEVSLKTYFFRKRSKNIV